MCTKKSEIYIISQPKKLILSILVVDFPLNEPLPDKIHDKLGWLTEFSDVFFVFSEQHYKEQRMVDKIKFTSLYQGCGFIDSGTKQIGTELMKIFQYEKEIFEETKNHLGITIGKLSNVIDYETVDFSKIVNSILSNISRPIYKIRRQTSSELFDIYEVKETLPYRKSKGKLFSTILNSLGRKIIETDKIGMYSTWHSESPFIYLPKIALNTILQQKIQDEEGFSEWVSTFVTIDPRYLLASLINYLGIEVLNLEITQVKV